MLPPHVWTYVRETGEPLQRLNLNVWMFIGATLERIAILHPKMGAFDAHMQLIRAEAGCEITLSQEAPELDFSRDACESLLNALRIHGLAIEMRLKNGKGLEPPESGWLDEIRAKHTKFSNLLSEELSRKDVYAVRENDVYSVSSLIENGHAIIPPSWRSDIPQQCLAELKQAGRCLAFELGTAAAFHIMRAVEVMLFEYWDVVVKRTRPPNQNRNWGVLLKDLADNGGDRVVIAAVTHFKDLHRNPIVHPEFTPTIDEAMVLWGATPAVIITLAENTAKCSAIQKRLAEPTPASSTAVAS